jgi:3-dehydroquinate synthase
MTHSIPALSISSRNGPYQVHFDLGLPEALAASRADGPTWLLVDAAVLAHHRAAVAAAFPETDRIHAIVAIEENKSYERVGPIFTWLLSTGFRRDSTLVAMGGGIVQDIASFVATVIMRGARWRLIPTTLLAQCDSCIGAKSSINIDRFKNQLGSFYAPADIYLITDLLRTLPDESMRSGFGEIVKFHLLDGQSAWQDIQGKLRWDDAALLRTLIHTSLAIKKRSIEVDEFDRGVRNLLNYGHTFGHAFESATNFAIPHGLAVAMGMSAATYISERLGFAPEGHHREVDQVLRKLYGPCIPDLVNAPISAIITAMGTDKKNVGGATFVILTRGPGRMEKTKVDLEQQIRPHLTTFLEQLSPK